MVKLKSKIKRKYQYLMYLIGAWFLNRAGDPFESINWSDD